MKFRHLVAASALALLAACSQPAAEGGAAPADATPVQVQAPAGVYDLDPTHAALLFSFQHNSVSNYTARFTRLEAKLNLDPANLSASSIEVTVDPTSVSTGFPGDYKGTHPNTGFSSWDEQISRDPNYLNSGAFPQITFKSTAVEPTGPRTAKVTGDLTFLGVTKPIELNATFNGELASHPFAGVPVLGFAAEGSFKRTDFGQPLSVVGDEVTIRFDGEFIQQATATPAA
jgi:polyisoprenoid-binding protein YceI